MKNFGDYRNLANLAHENREQSDYHAELLTVLKHARAAKTAMTTRAPLSGPRAKIWAHLTDVIDLVEREWKNEQC